LALTVYRISDSVVDDVLMVIVLASSTDSNDTLFT